MPSCSKQSNKRSSISLMLRDDTLYYAFRSKHENAITTGECTWPKGFSGSELEKILAEKSHIQCVIPPEDVQTIQLDKPVDMRGKALLDYARIELLNYIDAPLDDAPILLLNPEEDSSFLTTQVILKSTIKSHVNNLHKQGIVINRISFPDGGFADRPGNEREVMLVLDPKAPRIVCCYQHKITHIQTLSKATVDPSEGICPALAASLEQWLQRHCQQSKDISVSVVSNTIDGSNRWINYLSEKPKLANLHLSPYAIDDTANFSNHWVSLAANHFKEKNYIHFDICWAQPRHLLSRLFLWGSTVIFLASAVFIGTNLYLNQNNINSLKDSIASVSKYNKTIRDALGDKEEAVIGTYSQKKLRNNPGFLSNWGMLASRSFPGLWIDTLTLTKNTMTLVGSAASTKLFHEYTAWLGSKTNVREVVLNNLSPEKREKQHNSFKRSLAKINHQITSEEAYVKQHSDASVDTKRKDLKLLETQRNRLLLNDSSDQAPRFHFNLTLTLR